MLVPCEKELCSCCRTRFQTLTATTSVCTVRAQAARCQAARRSRHTSDASRRSCSYLRSVPMRKSASGFTMLQLTSSCAQACSECSPKAAQKHHKLKYFEAGYAICASDMSLSACRSTLQTKWLLEAANSEERSGGTLRHWKSSLKNILLTCFV